MGDASALEIFLRPTDQKRLEIAAVIYPDPLNTYSNILSFIKMMTAMGLDDLGFATVGIIYKWCNLAPWQCREMVLQHPGASPLFVCK